MREGLLAAHLQIQEYGQPKKIDNLTELAGVNKRELGEIGQDIYKAICHNIIDLCGSELILAEDVVKKGILGATFILF